MGETTTLALPETALQPQTQSQHSHRLLVILCGPSGSGKTSALEGVINGTAQHRGLELITRRAITCTTRLPRKDGEELEVNGVHYHFLSVREFFTKLDDGEILEWDRFPKDGGHYYGTPVESLETLWEAGLVPLLAITVRGVVQLKEALRKQKCPWTQNARIITIFIGAESKEVLLERLKTRGTMSPEEMARRSAEIDEEEAFGATCHFQVTNVQGALDDTVNEIREIILRENRS